MAIYIKISGPAAARPGKVELEQLQLVYSKPSLTHIGPIVAAIPETIVADVAAETGHLLAGGRAGPPAEEENADSHKSKLTW